MSKKRSVLIFAGLVGAGILGAIASRNRRQSADCRTTDGYDFDDYDDFEDDDFEDDDFDDFDFDDFDFDDYETEDDIPYGYESDRYTHDRQSNILASELEEIFSELLEEVGLSDYTVEVY
jgi:outer membrane receptor for Fe3+-dicitrate